MCLILQLHFYLLWKLLLALMISKCTNCSKFCTFTLLRWNLYSQLPTRIYCSRLRQVVHLKRPKVQVNKSDLIMETNFIIPGVARFLLWLIASDVLSDIFCDQREWSFFKSVKVLWTQNRMPTFGPTNKQGCTGCSSQIVRIFSS